MGVFLLFRGASAFGIAACLEWGSLCGEERAVLSSSAWRFQDDAGLCFADLYVLGGYQWLYEMNRGWELVGW